MISGLPGREPGGDVSHKPSSRLSVSGRPGVTFPALEHHRPWLVPIYTACGTEVQYTPQTQKRKNVFNVFLFHQRFLILQILSK